MASTRQTDEQILRDLPDDVLTLFSAKQRAALDNVLARLAAAEKVCEMVSTSLSPKQRKASEKKLYWWDVGIAVKDWEAVAKP